MRGMYIAFGANFFTNKISRDSSNGIVKKIYHQIKSMESAGIQVDFFNPYNNRNQKIYRFERRLPYAYLHKWIFDFDKVKKYDFIYIRKPWYMDKDLLIFLKQVKEIKPSIKVLLEIPTFPYDNELSEFKSIPLIVKDRRWRSKLYKYVNKVVTYSRDDFIFDIPTLKVSNAIDFKSVKRKNIANQHFSNELNIIACSSLAYWHGYDRAILGLAKFYKENVSGTSIKLHIVGDGEEMSNYKNLVKKNKLSNHVFFHGMLSGDKLDNIYDVCQIGLDSLGRHRSGVDYNSSLKGKEYAAKGLIIVSAVKTELDYDLDYNYYLKVPADESSINFNSIVNFYRNSLSRKNLQMIQKEIMSYAENNFDYDVAMAPIIRYIFK